MSLQIDKDGNLLIKIEIDEHTTIIDELEIRREAIYDAINEHNNDEFIGSQLHYGLTKILKDLDPTLDQWQQILNNK